MASTEDLIKTGCLGCTFIPILTNNSAYCSSVDAIDLTRLIVEESYKAGASDVKVNYSDSKLESE
jgi:hypothetical protein